MNEQKQKLIDAMDRVKGKKTFNTSSGTHSSKMPGSHAHHDDWAGVTKGKTKHRKP